MTFKVPIISGSKSDEPHVSAIRRALDGFGIESSWDVASAHREHKDAMALVYTYNFRPSSPVITVAGRSDALSGCVAFESRYPVIASRPDHNKPYDLEMYYFSTVGTPSRVAPGAVLGPEQTAGYVNRLVRMMQQPADYMAIAINRLDDDSCIGFSNEVAEISQGRVSVIVADMAQAEYKKCPVGVILGKGNEDDYYLINGAADSGRPVIYSPGKTEKRQLLELGRQFFHSDYRPEVAVVMDPKNAALYAVTVLGLLDRRLAAECMSYRAGQKHG